jgi:hypothetical protein
VRTAWPFKLPETKRQSRKRAELDQAQVELVGKALILMDGKARTVDKIWLDEFHGLRFSVRGFEGMWPLTLTDFGAQTPVDNQHDPYAAADTELGRT